MSAYLVEVSYKRPARRARLAARLRRRRAQWKAVVEFPACPTCAQPVQLARPLIVQGAEYYKGPATWKDPDYVKGYRLEPCGHDVAGFEMREKVHHG